MEEKRIIPAWASVLLLLLCSATIATNFLWMVTVEHAPVEIFAIALDILVALLAISYCVYGYRKNAAVFMRLFCSVLMCSKIFLLPIMMSYSGNQAIRIILQIAECAFAVVLAAGRDIGKKVSLSLVGAIFTIDALHLVLLLFDPSYASNTLVILTRVGIVVTSAVYLIMMIAKYRDKTERGTT